MSDLEEQEEYREDSQVEEGEGDDDFLTQFRAVLDKLREAGDSEELEQLESAYRIACDREHDFKTAAEIGQMLVQKNQQLMEELEEASIWRDQYDTQRDANNEILTTLERLEEANHLLQQQNQDYERSMVELRARCEVLQSEHVTAAEMHNALEEEVEKLQDKVRSLTLEQRVNSAYKEKTRQLFEQELTEELQEQTVQLQKDNASLRGDLEVLKTTSSKSQNAEYEVKQLREQVKSLKAMQDQNKQLKDKLAVIQEEHADLTSIVEENQRLTDAVNSLMKVNRHFREQQEKDQALLEEANHNIQSLQVAIEEQKLADQDSSLARDPSLVALELEQRVLDLMQRVLDDDPGSNGELNNVLEAEIARRADRLLAMRRAELETQYELELQRQLAKAREDINMKIMEMQMAKMVERGSHHAAASESAKRERDEGEGEGAADMQLGDDEAAQSSKRKKRSDTSGTPPPVATAPATDWEQGSLKRRSTDMSSLSTRRAAAMSLPPRKISLGSGRSTSPRRIFEKLAQHSPRSPLQSTATTIGLRAPSPTKLELPPMEAPMTTTTTTADETLPMLADEQPTIEQEKIEQPPATEEKIEEETKEEKMEEESTTTEQQQQPMEEVAVEAVAVESPAPVEPESEPEPEPAAIVVDEPEPAVEEVVEDKVVEEETKPEEPTPAEPAVVDVTPKAEAEEVVVVEQPPVVEQPTEVVAEAEIPKEEVPVRSLSAPVARNSMSILTAESSLATAASAGLTTVPALETAASPAARHIPPAKPVPPPPTEAGARRSFDDASVKRPRSNSITQSLASSSSFAASTLRDKVDSVFAKPSAPARKKDQRKTIMPEARALPRLHGPEEGSMSPFMISYRNPTQTLSLSPRGGKAGTTYTLHSRPHTPSLVEELLTSAFRLEASLNRINLFAMNSDEANTFRLIDVMTDHIVQHVVKAKSFNCPDELRQSQKEEGAQELQRLQSLVKPVVNLLFSESHNGAYHINFRTCLKQISEANSKIATACTLSFIDDSIKFIESKIDMPGVVEDEELQQQYRHLIELSPNILVMFKEALLNPEDSDRKRVLHASIDLANQIRFKIQRMGRARELPMTLSPSALRRPGSGLRTSAGVDTSTVEQIVSTPTPSFTSSSSTSSVDVDSSDGRDSKGKEKDHEKPLTVDIDQLRNEIAMELEDDELRILARIDNVVERQLRLLQIEERKHIHLILDLRDKLNDANLAVMNKTMRSVLSFNELVQLSDACIDNVLKESKKLFKLPGLRNPSLMALAIDLVIEVAVLMKRCNDFSVGINQPTLEKLEKFKKDYALRGVATPSPGRGGSPKKGAPGGGILSYFFGRG
ncbi:viral Atype inclusion protein, putative [Acanthamoeba castellanii str. Neff]|uniref:Viral Atype inclusion protein, putative n=1 Tax=Acanthamoeba castellanii (strain ATCC 30010 / Neff) TaxID=1257118 RepID=L8H376_ACACF|nr:viral Atype inclusion protein, putative [Acanthamoeba castellanii str. Neff]ELR19645.1 viral Atype inclusion protein, putative [Acanthamoeba castellanii str. Neff]